MTARSIPPNEGPAWPWQRAWKAAVPLAARCTAEHAVTRGGRRRHYYCAEPQAPGRPHTHAWIDDAYRTQGPPR